MTTLRLRCHKEALQRQVQQTRKAQKHRVAQGKCNDEAEMSVAIYISGNRKTPAGKRLDAAKSVPPRDTEIFFSHQREYSRFSPSAYS